MYSSIFTTKTETKSNSVAENYLKHSYTPENLFDTEYED